MTNYHPNPASALANLIHNGLATESPESLPPEWRAGYLAARQVSDRGGLYERRQAFQQAVAEEPARYIMEAEIEDASKDLSFIGQQRIYAAWETLDSPPPVSEFVVEGIFDRSSLNLLVGAPGGKKTWTAIDLAVSVASGQDWLGHRTNQSPVLILDAEGGVRRMWDRLGRTLRGHNADPKIPLYFMPPSFINFTRGDREAEYISKVANSLGARLIIIDALANVMGGADENNVLSVQPIFDTLRKLAKDTGAAVVVIHHANKQGLFRGSSFMSSSVDHMLLVESPPDDNLLSIRTFKARDLAPILLTARAVFNTVDSARADCNPPSPGFARRIPSENPGLPESLNELEINSLPLERGRVGDGVPTFHLDLVEDKLQAKLGRTATTVINHLAELGIASPTQLFESIPDLRPSSFRSVIHDLSILGLIVRADGGGRGSPAHYSLTPEGTQRIKGEKINELDPPPPTKTTTT